MDHFVAYHSAKAMGRPYPREEYFSFSSGKSESFLRSSIGQTVWVIAGEPQRQTTRYVLVGVYTPAEITSDDDGVWLISGLGENFLPEVEVFNGTSWFDDLYREQNNFSLGFNRIKSTTVIDALSAIRIRFKTGGFRGPGRRGGSHPCKFLPRGL
jgi:hypothetical protein